MNKQQLHRRDPGFCSIMGGPLPNRQFYEAQFHSHGQIMELERITVASPPTGTFATSDPRLKCVNIRSWTCTYSMPQPAVARTNTKAELLIHARALFARHGYEGVSMRDIAGSVGVRQSAIYNHFASKQDLLVDLMTDHMERLLDAIRAALAPETDPVGRLETFARFHVTYHIDHPDDVFLAYMELRSLEEEGRRLVLPLRRAYEKLLRDILEAGIASKVFNIGDPAVTTRAILAMLTGVTVWFHDGGRLDGEAVADTYVQAVLQCVGLSPGR